MPLTPLHFNVLDALAALEPATTLIAVKSKMEYAKVHWSPAG